MADEPAVDGDDFTLYTGIELDAGDLQRVVVAIGRARRRLLASYDLSEADWSDSDTAEAWADAMTQLAWFYWECEKSGAMEILALPVSQLSLGTLFWTKARADSYPSLPAVELLGTMFPTVAGGIGNRKVLLEDEIGYGG